MMRKYYRLVAPLIIFLCLCILFMIILLRDERSNTIPSALINSALPSFSVSSLGSSAKILTEKNLIGHPALINIWASWCDACFIEHHFLVQLAKKNILIFGINYKDDRAYAIEWLRKRGNPYKAVLYDKSGDISMLLGVFGAPETFLIDSNGIIRYRHIGILEPQIWENKILPKYKKLFPENQAL